MSTAFIQWQTGSPPRRGVWRVRSQTGRNPGYRYWDGKQWGCLFSTHALAAKYKMEGRRAQIRVPIQWGRVETVATVVNQVNALRYALQWVRDNPGAHPVNRAKVIDAALK